MQKLSFSSAAMIVTKMLSQRQKALLRVERIRIKKTQDYQNMIIKYEHESMNLRPKVEGRIICIRNNEVKFNF